MDCQFSISTSCVVFDKTSTGSMEMVMDLLVLYVLKHMQHGQHGDGYGLVSIICLLSFFIFVLSQEFCIGMVDCNRFLTTHIYGLVVSS